VIGYVKALKLIPVEKMSNATHFKVTENKLWEIASSEEEGA